MLEARLTSPHGTPWAPPTSPYAMHVPPPPALPQPQDTLRTSALGAWFFGQIANTKGA